MPHDDFAVEPIKGLPGVPPEGEDIVWQGAPNWWSLAKESLSLYWIFGYFVLLAVWRFTTVYDLVGTGRALAATVPFVLSGLLACLILMLIAYVQAKSTVYTITTKRVVLRIGAAFTISLNLPYTRIINASLGLRRDGTGNIALEVSETRQLSYFILWPHVRPWKMSKPFPTLRCIDEPERVAKLLAEAAQTEVNMPQLGKGDPQSASIVAAE